MLSGRNYEEKRAFIRMSVDCRVLYREAGAADTRCARGIDLSGGGLSFESSQPVAPDAVLNVSVVPEKPTVAPLEAVVRVVRVVRSGDGAYRVGARIQQIVN